MVNRILILASLFILSSCELFEDNSKRYSLKEIEELYHEIVMLSESIPCTNSAEWKFTPMGSKACGGPTSYISYHQSVETKFLKLVDQYTLLQQEYNRKNNVFSDCMLVVAPKTVTCEGGKPVLVN